MIRTKNKIDKGLQKDIDSNFLYMMKEILSSTDQICQGVQELAKEDTRTLFFGKGDKPKVVDKIIRKKARISKGVGIVANAPSMVPLVGTVGTVAFTSAVEFISLVRLQIEMCMEIAYAYGNKINEERLVEALAIVGWHYDKKNTYKVNKEEIDKDAFKNGVKKMVKSYVKKGIFLMAERLTLKIELAALRRSLSKFVPLLGMPIAAKMNHSETIAIGKLAEVYYN